MILAIDPGKTDSLGVALGRTGFEHGAILKAPKHAKLADRCMALEANLSIWLNGLGPVATIKAVVLEEMWHRPGPASAAATKKSIEILKLQAIGAWLASAVRTQTGCAVFFYPPHEWKGQLPKEVCHDRLFRKMTSDERLALTSASRLYGAKAHNLLDAASILHAHLGRL